MRIISSILFFLSSSFCYAGVERFLAPVSFELIQPEAKKVKKKVSAYIAKPIHNTLAGSSLHKHDVYGSIELDTALLESRIGEILKHRFQARGEVKIHLNRHWESIKVGPNFLVNLKSCSPDTLSPSNYLKIELWDEGVELGEFSFNVKVAHLENVYFAKKTLDRGARLSDDFFKIRKVDTLKQYANSVLAGANLKGYEIASPIRQDIPLKWNHLSKITLINKGAVVDVFAAGNGIYVTMKGMALEDGVEGSFVRVKNLSSEKEFHAKVLNENSVKVHL